MTKSHGVRNRRRARELAVQFLYSLETRSGQDFDESLSAFVSESGFAPKEERDVTEYLSFLAKGVWNERFAIDNTMRRIVTKWSPERMVAVDRAVLRMAIFEGFLEKKVPPAVAISEAVSLAAAFGTEDSGKFVNGALAKVVRYFTEPQSTELQSTELQSAELQSGERQEEENENDAVADSENSIDR
ncbi:MAG: transcription antitermination factor NusB [Synergistaceae bacterium]|nr:transcription antitermination factor NusB [Synergistaceae bacterium]